ncbi:unnamed protein product [Clavelina lepadiformis]|uniref:Uncharacterized protein n=1 Tax=Clavelina lepadiformis TaxID=159417 RepID=A0ABP0FMD6_CLALP
MLIHSIIYVDDKPVTSKLFLISGSQVLSFVACGSHFWWCQILKKPPLYFTKESSRTSLRTPPSTVHGTESSLSLECASEPFHEASIESCS